MLNVYLFFTLFPLTVRKKDVIFVSSKKIILIMTEKETDTVETVYINPRTDFGFKWFFGNSELLIDFLNGIVEDVHIRSVEYRPTEQPGVRDTERKAVYDLLCTTERGEYLLVEMQNVHQRYFADRALFYSACLIRGQAPRRKQWDYRLKAVYVVSILNFRLTEAGDNPEVIERVCLMNRRTKLPFSDKLEFIYVQLPNFKKTQEELQKNDVDNWLYLMRHLETLTSRPAEIQGPVFDRLFQLALYKQLNKDDMEAYKKSVLEYREIKDAVLFAEERAEKRGEKRGEKQSRIKFAAKCYRRGMSVVEIADMTDLPIEEVTAIVRRLSQTDGKL
jgi:predicted transposase/invertase (TIGR01784 family)